MQANQMGSEVSSSHLPCPGKAVALALEFGETPRQAEETRSHSGWKRRLRAALMAAVWLGGERLGAG